MTVEGILVIPLIAAILCWIPAIGRRVAPAVTLASSVAILGLTMVVAGQVLEHGTYIAVPDWLEVDSLGILILLLVAAVGVLSSLYSLGYMKRTTHNPSILHHYYGNLNLFIFSMVAVPVVVGPSVAWLAVEFTTLLSVLLVGFESNREALEAAWKYAIFDPHGRRNCSLWISTVVLGNAHGGAIQLHMGGTRECGSSNGAGSGAGRLPHHSRRLWSEGWLGPLAYLAAGRS